MTPFFFEREEIGGGNGKAEKGCFLEIFGFRVRNYASLLLARVAARYTNTMTDGRLSRYVEYFVT